MARKPPVTRAAIVLRTCPKPLFRAVDGITAPMKLALGRHCSRRQRDQFDCLRAAPLFDRMRTPIGAGDAGRMAFQPALGSHGQRRILPSMPRHHRVWRGASWPAPVGPPSARGAGARARDRSRRPKRRRRFGSREPGARGLSPRGRHIRYHGSSESIC